MNLQPSISIAYNERRALFADELRFCVHGQIYLSGNTIVYPDTNCVFYKIQFLTDSNVISAGFRSYNTTNELIYQAENFQNVDFPENYTWNAPLTSLALSSGSAIAYQYRKFIPEELICFNPCGPVEEIIEILTVEDESARYALTDIEPGQQVYQTDNSTLYQLNAPSEEQGGVFVSGGTLDGIYTIRGNYTSKLGFGLIGAATDLGGGLCIYWDTDRFFINDNTGTSIYYSLSDVATPDLATDWKNASDDSPASITVASVTQRDLVAGVTVSGAGEPTANGSILRGGGVVNGRSTYVGGTSMAEFVFLGAGVWEEVGISDYDGTVGGAFPWQDSYAGTPAPAPTVTRNDIAAPANWSVVP